MTDVYLNSPLNKEPKIKIINYVVEVENNADSQHPADKIVFKKTYGGVDILLPRSRACRRALKEAERLQSEGISIKLYCNYVDNKSAKEGKKSELQRFYLLQDYPNTSHLKLPHILENEYAFMLEAGLRFYSVEINDNGKMLYLPLGGLIDLPQKQ